jgi:SAM-dependent methyltransferase
MQEDNFAHLYDTYISNFEDDLPFWRSMVETFGSPVLELGCGTGRVILELAKSGYKIEGVDCDPAMLDLARSKLFPKYRETVRLHIGDIRNFSLPNRFPLIIIPCNTMAYFNDGECELILRCSKEHLDRGGHLVMELPSLESGSTSNAFDILEDETEILSTFISPRTDHPVQVSARRTAGPEMDVINITWYYDELLPNGTVRRFDQILRYHIRSAQSMKDLLGREGFTQIEIFSDCDLAPFSSEAQRLILKGQMV